METKKQTIKQKIVATTIVVFMLFMLFGSLNLPGVSATVTTTNLIQNVVAGTFGHGALSNIVFPDITVGSSTNSGSNMTMTTAWDLRGSGAGWTIAGYASRLWIQNSAVGVNNLDNTEIIWYPAGATIYALTGVTTGMTMGGTNALNFSRTLITAPVNNGMGNYRINGVMFNIVYNGRTDQVAGSYVSVLTMTSS
jgi:hypothetical protein